MAAPALERPFRKRGQPVSRGAAGSDFLEIAGPLASGWYPEPLRAKQTRDVALWTRHCTRDRGAGSVSSTA